MGRAKVKHRKMQQQKHVRKSRSHGQNNSAPHFNGKPETWSEFPHTFNELIRASQLGPVLELAMLKAKIPEKASRMIFCIMDPT